MEQKAPEPAPATDDQILTSIRQKNKEIEAEIEALEKAEKALRESIAKQQRETEDVNGKKPCPILSFCFSVE